MIELWLFYLIVAWYIFWACYVFVFASFLAYLNKGTHEGRTQARIALLSPVWPAVLVVISIKFFKSLVRQALG